MDRITFYRLRSFGFLHPGKEDWKRYTKRCFSAIPGSTIYGALANAMIKMECVQEHSDDTSCTDVESGCAYSQLLTSIKDKKIRFSPLVVSQKRVADLKGYNKAAQDTIKNSWENRHISPHTSVDRYTETARESQLFMNYNHKPFVDYYGFIAHEDNSTLMSNIKKAFNYFPCLPFGGDGKFCTTEVTVTEPIPRSKALEGFYHNNKACLLTPAIIDNQANLLEENLKSFPIQFKQYRFWRKGLYLRGSKLDKKGVLVPEEKPSTPAVMGLEESSANSPKLVFNENKTYDDLRNFFIEGFGHFDWTYLGWGQLVFEEVG